MRPTARVLVRERGTDRVLVVDHHGDPVRAGLPGGGLEPGETPAQAAERELWEETGLLATQLALVATVDEPGRKSYVFEARAWGWLRGSEEGPVRWARPAELARGKHGAFHRALFYEPSCCAGISSIL